MVDVFVYRPKAFDGAGVPRVPMICMPDTLKSAGTEFAPLSKTSRTDRNEGDSVIAESPEAMVESITVVVAKLSFEPSRRALSVAFHVPGKTEVGEKLSGIELPLDVGLPPVPLK